MSSMSTSYQHCLWIAAALIAGPILTACKPPDDPSKGGTSDTGIMVPNVDFAGETGGEEQPLPTGECVQKPQGGLYGYWHQCEGWLEVSFEAKYKGKSYGGADILYFGIGQTNPDYWTDPDSYEMPLVAACCGPFDYDYPTTEEKVPYVNNCLYDAVQQICIGLPHILRKQAEDTDVGDGKLALEFLADRIQKNASDCRSGLWEGGPPGPHGQAINQLSGTSWSPPKTPATIRIVNSEIYDWTIVSDITDLTKCSGIYDNDPAIVPTAPFSGPGSFLPLAENSSATASGPWFSEGRFTISKETSRATIDHDESGSVLVTGLRLDAEPTSVFIAGHTVAINYARLLLPVILRPSSEGDEWVVGMGDATFTAMLTISGGSRIASMRNADPIVFRHSEGVWEFDPFDLVYEEVGVGQWTLTLDGLDFDSGL